MFSPETTSNLADEEVQQEQCKTFVCPVSNFISEIQLLFKFSFCKKLMNYRVPQTYQKLIAIWANYGIPDCVRTWTNTIRKQTQKQWIGGGTEIFKISLELQY